MISYFLNTLFALSSYLLFLSFLSCTHPVLLLCYYYYYGKAFNYYCKYIMFSFCDMQNSHNTIMGYTNIGLLFLLHIDMI